MIRVQRRLYHVQQQTQRVYVIVNERVICIHYVHIGLTLYVHVGRCTGCLYSFMVCCVFMGGSETVVSGLFFKAVSPDPDPKGRKPDPLFWQKYQP